MSNLQNILQRYLDDRDGLSEEELGALVAALRQSPDLAAEVKQQLLVDELLGQRMAIDRRDFRAQVVQRISDLERGIPRPLASEDDLATGVREMRARIAKELTAPPSPRRRARLVTVSALAAAAIVVLATAAVWFSMSASPKVAVLQLIDGNAVISRDGQQQTVSGRVTLRRGDLLCTSLGSAFTVRYGDGTVVRIGGNTAVEFGVDPATNAKRVLVERGHVYAHVAPQPDHAPMLFDTSTARATVVGTSLSLIVTRESTRLEVEEGTVELRRKYDDTGVLVTAGQFALASPHCDVAVRRSTFPVEHWRERAPERLGFDAAVLEELSDHVGGHGCVVRDGYLAYMWGDPGRPGVVYGVSDALLTHLLLKAFEDGHLADLDEPVSVREPRLNGLNAALNYKDRTITWRQLAQHTSCYGVAESPGKAFGVCDLQSTLLFEALAARVWAVSDDRRDEDLLRARLTDLLGCEDEPSFATEHGYVRISPRDLARFGWLYLQGGRFGDQTLLRPDSIALALGSPLDNGVPPTAGRPAETIDGRRPATAEDSRSDHLGSYSLGWWVNGTDRHGRRMWPDAPDDTFAALGRGGRDAVCVLPGLNVVVAYCDAEPRDLPADQAEQVSRYVLQQIIRAAVRR